VSLPKVFISELLVEQLSREAQQVIADLLSQLAPEKLREDDFCCSGRHWDISYKDYCLLLKESEYAAWLAAFGYQPNHFTISVNHLTSHSSLEGLNQFLVANNVVLNTVGGLIKGSPAVYLEQSSTMANVVDVEFTEQKVLIPSCYYEFSRRYPLADGSLYQGFITHSADKIFESTDVNTLAST
jgi:hypothetical protein